MDAELIFAEDVEVCPKCGSSEFWENRMQKITITRSGTKNRI